MPPDKARGFALIIEKAGRIEAGLYALHPGLFELSEKNNLADWVDAGSQEKLELFLKEAIQKGRADGWEVIMNYPHDLKRTLLFGYAVDERILVIAAPDAGQADQIRLLVLEEAELPAEWQPRLSEPIRGQIGEYTDQQSIDDISALNNEIIVLQRELVKKQTQLEQMNAAIQQYSLKLEELVAERTRELRISEAKFRGIFEASSLGIAIISGDGSILTANQAMLNMIGCATGETCQHKITEVFFDAAAGEFGRIFNDLQASQEKNLRLEKPFTRHDGSARWADILFFLIKPDADQPALAINIVEDTTEKRATQQALIQAEKLSAVGKIAASLAHEINNPLQAVVGNLGLAQESLKDNPALERYIHIATNELKRVSHIVADLRDASRKPAIKERSAASIDEIIQKVVDLTRKKCEEKKITLSWKNEPKIPLVLVSADQIVQVVLNLVINAIEAMPDGGDLCIQSQRSADPPGVIVIVSDTGAGIPEEVRSRLFEPFISTKQEGMGMGLYISREIITTHKGKLDIVPNHGKGAAFKVWLPADDHYEISYD